MSRDYIIVVAAGSGRRFGSDLPKQYCMMGGRPVLMHTLANLHRAMPRARIILVLHPDYEQYWREQCRSYHFDVEYAVVHGGATRSDSVRNALSLVPRSAECRVYVHDGARPLVDAAITAPVADALAAGALAVVPVIPVTDSLRETAGDAGSVPVDRSRFLAVQTPQGFRADILARAYEIADAATDDASLVQSVMPDVEVTATPGAPYNIKITTPLDIAVAEALSERLETI